VKLNSYTSNSNTSSLYVWAAVIIALSVCAYFYRVSLVILVNFWNEYGTYSHGYLTVLLSVFLIYTCIKQAKLTYSGPSAASALAVFCISLVWFVAHIANVNTIQMLCLPFVVFFTISYFLGLKNFKTLIVPVFILLFTVPIWTVFLPLLQEIAVVATDKLLSFSSLEYLVVDNRVIFSKGIFQIEESCSGLRYLLVGVLLALVYGYLNYQSNWSTLYLIISTVVIMLVGNIIRILLIIWLGVVKGMNYHLVQDHESLGWAIFAFLLIPMFIIARFMSPNIFASKQQEASDIEIEPKSIKLASLFIASVLYLVVISIAPLYAGYVENRHKQVASLDSGGFLPMSGWKDTNTGPIEWAPDFNLYRAKFIGQYTLSNQTVVLHTRLYNSEQPEGELINFNNQVVDKRIWRVIETSYNERVTGGTEKQILNINKLTIRSFKGNRCQRIWYWFDIAGETYTNKWQVKLQETIRILNGKSGSAFTAISTECNTDTDQTLKNYLVGNYSKIKNLIVW